MPRGIAGVRIDKRKLQETIRNAPQKADDMIGALAFEGERYVKQSFGTSPSSPGDPPGVDTGNLRNSINVQRVKQLVRSINTGAVEYAIYLEYGTSRMAARPYMRPMRMWLEGEQGRVFRGFLED